jgi:hypothetical protein
MRYIVVFMDKSAKHVTEEQAQAFRAAMKSRGTVDFRNGTYAGSMITKVIPISTFESEEREKAKLEGKFRCKYGFLHSAKNDCGCKDAGFQKILSPEEEILALEESKYASLPSPSTNGNLLAMPE